MQHCPEDKTPLVVVSTPAEGVRQLLLDDPAGRNAINASMRAALGSALTDALDDPTVRAIVIGSSSRNFCTGGDLASISAMRAGIDSLELMEAAGRTASLLATSRKPLIAAVQGHCVGAGVGLALLCDTIVAAESVAFSFPFLKLGLVADFGISRTLAARIGAAPARQVLLYARTLHSAEALQRGLVDEVVPETELLGVAVRRAAELAAMPVHPLWLLRQLLRADGPAVDRALREEAMVQSSRFGSAELAEGIAAFREKRAPDFRRAARPTEPGT